MAAKSYPDPKPFVVLNLPDLKVWRDAGQVIPTEQQYDDHVAASGVEGGPYGLWREKVEAVMASHSRRKADPVAPAKAEPPVQAPAPVRADVIPPAPTAMPMLPWNRGRPVEVVERPLNVDLPVATLAALKRYAAARNLKLKVVVAGMLDAMLAMDGCPPEGK